jgi:hypothetical protein
MNTHCNGITSKFKKEKRVSAVIEEMAGQGDENEGEKKCT